MINVWLRNNLCFGEVIKGCISDECSSFLNGHFNKVMAA